MELIDMIVLGLVMLLGIILSILAEKNRELHRENSLLKEILMKTGKEEEETPKEVLPEPKIQNETPSDADRIAALIAEGKDVDEVARVLEMPINKVEMIIKFEKIKKDHAAS